MANDNQSPQWKWYIQQERGMKVPKLRELYYTGEVLDLPKDRFQGEGDDFRKVTNAPDEMLGKKWRVIGIGGVNPDYAQLLYQQKETNKKKTKQVDPGPKATIDITKWKSGEWKVAKVLLNKDKQRADKEWMTFGSNKAYRQYKYLEEIISKGNSRDWTQDDDFSSMYLIKVRRAIGNIMNKRVESQVRNEARVLIQQVRDLLNIPPLNDL
tara:strand:+ start:4142 stop:4774 length:633 start_codon:yes stop_codon:yes gene_type:complete